MTILTKRSEQRAFGGVQGFYEHQSACSAGPMRFGVYLPPQALAGEKVPVLYFLPGLTCTEETFFVKAGAQRKASELGIALVSCDTSPRASRYPGDDASWAFGQGAGFYVDATEAPWSATYQMATYATDELREVIEAEFPVSNRVRGISGHSMGGHGALTLALRAPGLYASVSAFAPIVAPSRVPWGEKAFAGYLGPDRSTWDLYDAVSLLESHDFDFGCEVLIDQGTSDRFLAEQLRPELFRQACAAVKQPLSLRMRDGYDHGYYFVATFIDEHLAHHARAFRAA